MRLSSPCWAVTSVSWSCFRLLFDFDFCDCVVGTALEACEPFSYYSVIPVTISEKIKHQCSESLLYLLLTVSSCFVEADCFAAHRSSFQRRCGKEATAQQLSCKLCNPWTTLAAGALCQDVGWPVSRMAHFLRDCIHARPRAHCGLLNCWVCLLWAFLWFCLRHSLIELFSYNTVWAFHLLTTECALSQVTSAPAFFCVCFEFFSGLIQNLKLLCPGQLTL